MEDIRMDKKTKAILWGVGILVVIAIILTTYACITGNDDIAAYYAMGVLISLFASVLIGSAVFYLVGLIRLHNKKKNINQEKITSRKALPI